MSEKERKESGRSPQAPDGGWGWMVVTGSAVAHMFLIPVLQNFTLIFKDQFTDLSFSSTDITTLVSLNASFGMILGLFNGPILKIFSYRKVAFVGLTLYIIGIFCTGIAESYVEFIIFYGLLSSLGLAMVMASFSLAINTYFVKNRSKAVGYSMTLTGLGPMFMPFVISYLLSSYGLKWTVFLLSGLCLHAFIGVLVLQPVKWHRKLLPENIQQENENSRMWISDVHSILEIPAWGSKMSLPADSIGHSARSRRANSVDKPEAENEERANQDRRQMRKLSVTFLDNDDYKNMMSSTLHMIDRIEILGKLPKCASAETLGLDRLSDYERRVIPPADANTFGHENKAERLENSGRASVPSNSKKRKIARWIYRSLVQPLNHKSERTDEEETAETEGGSEEDAKRGLFCRAVYFLKVIYDIDLFQDLLYINMVLGLSMAFTGEVIFSTMTPIILKDIGFNTEEMATFMSVIAGCDLLCRFIAPFVGKKLNLGSKKMYLIALAMLLISRASMFLATSYETYILVSLGLGIGKGFRSVFWVLVLPDYVPLSKLPSASAFQSLMNGILILVSGPIIGAVTSLTKNYFSVIVASNILTLTTIILWCGEIIYLKYKKKYLI